MKPCPEHGASIALLAAESLEPSAEAVLREHLATCARCRTHLQELQQIRRTLEQAAEDVEAHELPSRFHQRLEARLRQDPTASLSVSWRDRIAQWFSVPGITLAGGVALLAVLALVLWRSSMEPRDPQTATLGSTHRETSPADPVEPGQSSTPAPTLMVLRQAWNGSAERLDALLAQQERLLAANDPATTALGGPLIGF